MNAYGFDEGPAVDAKSETGYDRVMTLILPFLRRLRDSEADVIRWPADRRRKDIDGFMKQLRDAK